MSIRGCRQSYNPPWTSRIARHHRLYSRSPVGLFTPIPGPRFGINGTGKPHFYRLCQFKCRSSKEDDGGASTSVPDTVTKNNNAVLTGNLLLLIVSILWGSYTPALRAIFTLDGAPPPLVVAAARGVLQASLLGVAVAIGTLLPSNRSANGQSSGASADTHGSIRLDPLLLGSLEIGAYNTFGTILQTWGLSLSSATRAAFLVQATALWTPILSVAFGMYPSRILWISSFVALASTVFVTMDSPTSGGGIGLEALAFDMSTGDLATLAAAFCYSMATVRIPLYAKKVEPLKLALGKSLVLTTISVIGVATQMFGVPWSDIIPLHISQGHTVQVLSLIAWSAVGPGAVSAYLHVKGQSMVSPTDAQIIFTSVPLWSAIIASIFLPDERIGTLTWIGGAGLVIAGLIATFSADKK